MGDDVLLNRAKHVLRSNFAHAEIVVRTLFDEASVARYPFLDNDMVSLRIPLAFEIACGHQRDAACTDRCGDMLDTGVQTHDQGATPKHRRQVCDSCMSGEIECASTYRTDYLRAHITIDGRSDGNDLMST